MLPILNFTIFWPLYISGDFKEISSYTGITGSDNKALSVIASDVDTINEIRENPIDNNRN